MGSSKIPSASHASTVPSLESFKQQCIEILRFQTSVKQVKISDIENALSTLLKKTAELTQLVNITLVPTFKIEANKAFKVYQAFEDSEGKISVGIHLEKLEHKIKKNIRSGNITLAQTHLINLQSRIADHTGFYFDRLGEKLCEVHKIPKEELKQLDAIIKKPRSKSTPVEHKEKQHKSRLGLAGYEVTKSYRFHSRAPNKDKTEKKPEPVKLSVKWSWLF